MKKYLYLLLLIPMVLLSGCNVEEKVNIPNSDPEQLFVSAQALLKDAIPTAKFDVNVNERVLKATSTDSVDYPPYVEMFFQKVADGTLVTIIAPDDDQRKLKNLYHLLKERLQEALKVKAKFKDRPWDPASKKGRKVRNPKEFFLDRNGDGIVSPKERRRVR